MTSLIPIQYTMKQSVDLEFVLEENLEFHKKKLREISDEDRDKLGIGYVSRGAKLRCYQHDHFMRAALLLYHLEEAREDFYGGDGEELE